MRKTVIKLNLKFNALSIMQRKQSSIFKKNMQKNFYALEMDYTHEYIHKIFIHLKLLENSIIIERVPNQM